MANPLLLHYCIRKEEEIRPAPKPDSDDVERALHRRFLQRQSGLKQKKALLEIWSRLVEGRLSHRLHHPPAHAHIRLDVRRVRRRGK